MADVDGSSPLLGDTPALLCPMSATMIACRCFQVIVDTLRPWYDDSNRADLRVPPVPAANFTAVSPALFSKFRRTSPDTLKRLTT
ncbi:MAG: hypothetical protein R3C68_06385 [Myxococcota bacterium]